MLGQFFYAPKFKKKEQTKMANKEIPYKIYL